MVRVTGLRYRKNPGSEVPLRREGSPVLLPPKAFAVLCTLARTPGVLVTKSDLLDAVWGHQHVSESVLKTTISELRAALGEASDREPASAQASRLHGERCGPPRVTFGAIVRSTPALEVKP